jgi:hypothetical protein
MARFATPFVILAILVVTAGCGQSTSAQAPTEPPVAIGPQFDLSLAATEPGASIPDTGPFTTDASATTNTCSPTDDGFWQMRYSGGDPYVRMALLVGPGATAGESSDEVSAEIVLGSPLTTLLNFDQPGYRSGDAPGRSTATVEATSTADAITFVIAATTPRAKVDFSDYPYTVDIDLKVVCPLGE